MVHERTYDSDVLREKILQYAKQGMKLSEIEERISFARKRTFIKYTIDKYGIHDEWRKARKKRIGKHDQTEEIACRSCKYRERYDPKCLCNYILITGHMANCGQKNNYQRYEKDDGNVINRSHLLGEVY